MARKKKTTKRSKKNGKPAVVKIVFSTITAAKKFIKTLV